MSLDISPDGREIVFDLLGDLYTLPIEGGAATALTSGMAWDMQPSNVLDKQEDEAAAPPAGVDISFDTQAARPEGVIALTGASVVTRNRDEIVENGVIVVESNRIQAVGPASEVAVSPGAERIDCYGATILPGLIEPHRHGPYGSDELIPERNWSLDAAPA